MNKKCFKNLIVAILVLALAATSNVTASNVIIQGGIENFYEYGPGFASELIVTGDSYARNFYNDEKNKGIKFYGFFQEGQTLEENRGILLDAFNSFYKLIFLSISVNDRHRSTHPSQFEKELRELFEIARNTGKFVFVHSYMFYDLASAPVFPYTTFEYDAMIRKIIMDYDNVYFIDMSDCVGKDYMLPDGVHYNKKFNDKMFERINFMIDLIRKKYE